MSRVPDMPAEPTMADLARHMVALHRCVHEGQEAHSAATAVVAEELRAHRADSQARAETTQAQLSDLRGRVSYTEGALKIISKVLGAPAPSATPTDPTPQIRRRLSSIEPWQAGLALVAAVAAAGPGYKLIVAAFTSLHGALMGAG